MKTFTYAVLALTCFVGGGFLLWVGVHSPAEIDKKLAAAAVALVVGGGFCAVKWVLGLRFWRKREHRKRDPVVYMDVPMNQIKPPLHRARRRQWR